MKRIVAALALLTFVPPAAGQPVKPSEPVLVVPFDNGSGDASLQWLSEASALLLTRDLGRFGATAVSRDERLKAFERLGLPASALLSQATIIRVGQVIGVAHAAVGVYTVENGLLRLRVRTIRLDTGSMLDEIVEEGPVDRLFALVEGLARRMVGGTAGQRPAPASERALPAFELYVKGLTAETPGAQIRLLQAALARAPGDDEARLALWQVHTAQGEHERALAAVAKVAPGSGLAHRARFLAALSELALGRHEAAFDALKALSEEAPAATTYNNLGVVQLRRGATPQAGRATYYLTKAVDLAPEDPDYAFNLGYAYWFERDPQGAIYWLREAVRRNPADADAHFVLGVALAAGGATVEGERERELARQLSSMYAEMQHRRGPVDEVPRGLERLRVDLEAPRLSLAERAAAPGEQRDLLDLAAFHRDRGRRLFDSLRDLEAMGELKRSLYLQPYQADVHLLIGRLHQRAGRQQEAIESFRISIWCQPTAEAHVALGELLLSLEDPLGAQTEANRALALDLSHPAARALLAKATTK
jgi:tetratricopeptide (TPR) repeat protein